MENKNHLIACSVARDVLDEIISTIEEENTIDLLLAQVTEGLSSLNVEQSNSLDCLLHSLCDDDPKYFMTIWLKDDPNQEAGRGRYFDTEYDAMIRFEQIKETLHSCLIMEETDDYEKAIFTWREDGGVGSPLTEEECLINYKGKEYYVLPRTKELLDIETGEVVEWRYVYDDDCNHVGYWTGESIEFITKR